MRKTIYFNGLGYRDPIVDGDTLIWYFQQTANTKAKGHETRYWLDLKEWYGQHLLDRQAYEVYDFINRNATAAKIRKREQSRKKAKEKAEKEMEALNKMQEQWKINRELINLIQLN